MSEMSSLMDDTEIMEEEYPSRGTSPGKVVTPVNVGKAVVGSSIGEPVGDAFLSDSRLNYDGLGLQVDPDNEENVEQGDDELSNSLGGAPCVAQGSKKVVTFENAIDGRGATLCKPSSPGQRSYYILKIDPALNAEATIADQGPRSVSPPSSQGSLSSMEFLDRNVQHIEKKTTNFRETMWDAGLGFSNKQHDLLSKLMKDKSFKERLRSFIINDCKSYLASSGKMHDDPRTSKGLLKTLKRDDSSTLLARVGKMLVENHCGEGRSKSSETTGNSKTDKSYEPETISSEIVLQPPFNNASAVDSLPSPFKENAGDVVLMDETPNANTAGVLHRNDGVGEMSPLYRFGKTEDELNRLIAKAYDSVADNDSKCKQIFCAGQALFRGIFTEEEIRECTLSGKKTKARKEKTKRFDEEKVRFINQTICWLLTKPVTKGIRALEAAVAERDERLSPNDNKYMRQHVFSEFGYSRRPKLNSKEEPVKTEGEGSGRRKRQKRQ